MGEGGDAVFAEREALHFDEGGVLLDGLSVRTRPGAVVEDWGVFVGCRGEGVEAAAGEGAEAVEVGREVGGEVWREVEGDEAGERGVGSVEVQAVGVGDGDGLRKHGSPNMLSWRRMSHWKPRLQTHRENALSGAQLGLL